MATTVLEIIPGRLKHNKFTREDLRPVEIEGDAEKAVLDEMTKWTIVRREETSLSHEDMGDYDCGCETINIPLVELKKDCIVAHGKLIGVSYNGVIFFTNGKSPIGKTEYTTSYENGRSTYYTDVKLSLKRDTGVTVVDGVIYHAKDGNRYHTLHFAPKDITSVEIHPDTVEISECAFKQSALEKLVLPDKVKYIRKEAFWECKNLREVYLGKGLYSIGEEAFRYCYKLEVLDIPEGLELIKTSAFDYCSSLKKLVLPDTVTNIWSGAFNFCRSLGEVVLSKNLKELLSIFACCKSLTTIEIPESVTSIYDNAFSDCISLYSVKLPSGLDEISPDAFRGCYNLIEIIKEGPLKIKYIFKEITAEEWGKDVHSGESHFVKEGDFLFYSDKDGTMLTAYLGTELEITLPESFKGEKYRIRGHAFKNAKVESITLPDSYTELSPFAFYGCETLKRFRLSPNITELPKSVFDYCKSLEEIELHEGIVRIGENALKNTKIKTLVIPDSVTTIEKAAFEYCKELTEVKIGAGIDTISCAMFSGCTSLASITIPEGIRKLDAVAFSECSSLVEVNLPSTIKEVGHSVFKECTALANVPRGLPQISWLMFDGCDSLVDIDIPEGPSEIGYIAFLGCKNLRSVKIPASVHKIQCSAFRNCGKLTEIRFAHPDGWPSSWRDPLQGANYFRRNQDSDNAAMNLTY